MAFGDTVQTSPLGSSTSGEASATLSAGATAGNLLIFAVARATTTAITGDWGTISGWTLGPASPADSGNMCGSLWWKIAAGSETTATTAMTGEAGSWTATITEYEGPFDATPLDVTAEDESHISATTVSKSSGTTATTAQADALAIAVFCHDQGSNIGTTQYTNSFTEVVLGVSGARAAHTVAKKVLSATGTQETTLSYSSGGAADEMYGCIAVFKASGGGGGAATNVGWFGAGWW